MASAPFHGAPHAGSSHSPLEVEDLEGYWREIEVLKLPDAFPGVSMKPPADLPWGREVHIIDPAGVCWHMRQAA